MNSSKEQHLFELKIFCNIINVFTITFDQFNASLLNQSVNSVKGLVHPKMKICLFFTHPQSIIGVYDFLLSDESNRSNIKNCPAPPSLTMT